MIYIYIHIYIYLSLSLIYSINILDNHSSWTIYLSIPPSPSGPAPRSPLPPRPRSSDFPSRCPGRGRASPDRGRWPRQRQRPLRGNENDVEKGRFMYLIWICQELYRFCKDLWWNLLWIYLGLFMLFFFDLRRLFTIF